MWSMRSRGLTQRKLANVLQVSPNTVARWERAELRIRDPERLVRRLDRLHESLSAGSRDPVSRASVPTACESSQGDQACAVERLPRGRRLPSELSSFIGREAELTHLGQLLKTARLLTLTGAGGVGKT